VKVVVSAVIGNSVITVAKFIGWFFTASPSMLAEAIHSSADTANQILLYVGISQSQKEPTREFPFGTGNARYLWNLVSAVAVFFIGFGVTVYHGIHSLVHLDELEVGEFGLLPTMILVGAFLLEGYVFILAWREVNRARGDQGLWDYIHKGDDPTAVAVLLEDGVAVVGVVLAMFGIWLSQMTNSPLPDAITSIIIGIMLGVLALILAKANGRLLIGVSVEPAEEKSIRHFIEARHSVEKVTSIKTEVMGPDRIHLIIEIEFHGSALINRDQIRKDAKSVRDGDEDLIPILVSTAERTVRTVGREINLLESEIQKKFPQIVAIQLEVN